MTMNRVLFDLNVLLFWSADSLDSKRLVSKGSVVISDNSVIKALEKENAEIDPDIIKLLQSLKKAGFAIYLCDGFPENDLRAYISKFGVSEYFDDVISANSAEDVSSRIREIRNDKDFLTFAGCNETAIEGATLSQVPSIAYGERIRQIADKCFCIALSPLEIEDQINILYIVHTLAKRAIEKNSRVMGIDGIAYAGKKVLAEKLLRYFEMLGKEAHVVDLEDFHQPVEETYKGQDPVESYYFNGYNFEKLIDEVLKPFKENGKIDTTVYCLDSNNAAYINEYYFNISENGIMILLGSMMYRDPLIEYFDMTVYMHVDYREAEHRVSLEDVPVYGDDPVKIYREKDIPAQKLYVQRHDPFSKRDFVIDNSNYHRPFFIT